MEKPPLSNQQFIGGVWPFLLFSVIAVISPTVCGGASPPGACEVDNGLVTFRCDNKPLGQVVKQVVEEAGLEIYLLEALHEKPVSVEFVKEPVAEVLRRLLRGCSHAVIHSQVESDTVGVRSVRGKGGSENSNLSKKEVSYPMEKGGTRQGRSRSTKETALREKIRTLETRMRSGASDRDYEKWVRVRGERFATHDKERLQGFKDELESLLR